MLRNSSQENDIIDSIKLYVQYTNSIDRKVIMRYINKCFCEWGKDEFTKLLINFDFKDNDELYVRLNAF